MTALNVILITSIRLSLFVGCRWTVLPLLVGEARHASLDESDVNGSVELDELPQPATYTSHPGQANRSGSLVSRVGSSLPRWQSLVQSLRDPHQASSHVFSLCFEESTILFVLVLLEATGDLSTQILRRNWTFSLVAVVILAVLLIRT